MLNRALGITLAVLFRCSIEAQMVAPSELKFEVASVKPSRAYGECASLDPGRFTCTRPLKDMVIMAFEVPAYQQLDPAFMRASRRYEEVFQIVATVPREAAKNWGIPPKGNFEQQMAMLRRLLIDRFALTYHYEKREVQAYSLTVDKAGLKLRGDPMSKLVGAPKDYVPPAGSISRRWHAPAENWLDVTRASMREIAQGLSRVVFQGSPVTDDTGLRDVYSFNLHFETLNYIPPPATAEPTEPLPTIFQALRRQGLKLTPQKVMADFFVIDHLEKSPTEN